MADEANARNETRFNWVVLSVLAVGAVAFLSFLNADTVLSTISGRVAELATGRERRLDLYSGTIEMDQIAGDAAFPEYTVVRSSRSHWGVLIPWRVEYTVVIAPKGNPGPIPASDAAALKEHLGLASLDASTGRFTADRVLWLFVVLDILLVGLIFAILVHTLKSLLVRRAGSANESTPMAKDSRNN